MSKPASGPSESSPTATPGKRPGNRRVAGFQRSLVLIALLGAAVLGVLEFQDRTNFVSETDARVAGKLITVSSRVAGRVTAVNVVQGDRIEPGQIIARIDDRESLLLSRQLEDQIKATRAESKKLNAERDLIDKQTQTRYETQISRLRASEASLASLEAKRDLARNDLKRAQSLRTRKVISEQRLDQTRAEARQVESEYRMSSAEVEESRAVLGELQAERAQLNVLEQELEMVRHDVARLQGQLEQRKLDLSDRSIRSTVNGVVDRVFVESGEYVTPGQRLAIIHDPEDIWVEANIKETQIRRLTLGQRVNISVDAFPDEPFEGKLEAIGDATTASFALLPNPNPSGNFTKVTQRLPIRIGVNQRDNKLRPGMMVEIRIDVRADEAP